MEDKQKTLAAVTIIIGFIVLVVIFIGALLSGKKVISPIPDSGAIRIIFVTPTSITVVTLTPTDTPTPTPTPKPKPKPTATPAPLPKADTPTPASSASGKLTPTP